MKSLKYLIIFSLVIAVGAGCSKKKEDAAKLEQELLNQDTVTDTVYDTTEIMTDSSAKRPDAGAIPKEASSFNMPQQPAGDGYVVQVASCPDEAYAQQLVDLYTKRGYQPFVTHITFEGETYYRVRLGIYDNLSDAKAMQKELLDKYSLSTWVDPVQGF